MEHDDLVVAVLASNIQDWWWLKLNHVSK